MRRTGEWLPHFWPSPVTARRLAKPAPVALLIGRFTFFEFLVLLHRCVLRLFWRWSAYVRMYAQLHRVQAVCVGRSGAEAASSGPDRREESSQQLSYGTDSGIASFCAGPARQGTGNGTRIARPRTAA
ncbi:hypothetical protein F5884DRAFT_27982 [Xylogone sp. PMI_703]|nr:hypothetical protein F5884DRAFT_27982 [Xylogone sp. PMI_703]